MEDTICKQKHSVKTSMGFSKNDENSLAWAVVLKTDDTSGGGGFRNSWRWFWLSHDCRYRGWAEAKDARCPAMPGTVPQSFSTSRKVSPRPSWLLACENSTTQPPMLLMTFGKPTGHSSRWKKSGYNYWSLEPKLYYLLNINKGFSLWF